MSSHHGERIGELEAQISELRNWTMLEALKTAPNASVEWINGITYEEILDKESGEVIIYDRGGDPIDWQQTDNPEHRVTALNWWNNADIAKDQDVYLVERPWGWEILMSAPEIKNAQTYEPIADQEVGDVQLYDVTPGVDPLVDPPTYALTGEVVKGMNWWNKEDIETGVDVYLIERPWGVREIIMPPSASAYRVVQCKLIGSLTAGGSTTATVYGDGSPTSEVITVYDYHQIKSGETIAAEKYIQAFCDDRGSTNKWILIYRYEWWTTQIYYDDVYYGSSEIYYNSTTTTWTVYSGVTWIINSGVTWTCNGTATFGGSVTFEGSATFEEGATFDEPNQNSTATGIVAHAGGGQGSATQLTAEINDVTVCANHFDSVKLPAATVGLSITVQNGTANQVSVFPQSGETIHPHSVNEDDVVPSKASGVYRCTVAGEWNYDIVFYSSAPTSGRGLLKLQCADNTANYEICITNEEMGQDTIIRIPDPGVVTTDIVVTDGDQSIGGDITFEDETTFQGETTFDTPSLYDMATGIVAHAGGGQGSATALTAEINDVTTVATNFDSVRLPTAKEGLDITVVNAGAKKLAVYPASGEKINPFSADEADLLPVGAERVYHCTAAGEWQGSVLMYLPAPSSGSGGLAVSGTDNTGDYVVTVTNAATNQETIVTIPDTGQAQTDFILKHGAQQFEGVQTFNNDVIFGNPTRVSFDDATDTWIISSSTTFQVNSGATFNADCPVTMTDDVTFGTATDDQFSYDETAQTVTVGDNLTLVIPQSGWSVGGVTVTATAADLNSAGPSGVLQSATFNITTPTSASGENSSGITLPDEVVIVSIMMLITVLETTNTGAGLDVGYSTATDGLGNEFWGGVAISTILGWETSPTTVPSFWDLTTGPADRLIIFKTDTDLIEFTAKVVILFYDPDDF